MPNETLPTGGTREIQVSADLAGLDTGRDFVVNSLLDLGADSETTFALTTSYLELFENLINHGYSGRAGRAVVEIEADEKAAKIKVIDTAHEFNILEYRDPGQADMIKKGITGKMGIKTIMALCDEVLYSREAGRNKYVLCRNRR
jgi:anti-sigma regulatory factor (Ser/Thr protein kinase)